MSNKRIPAFKVTRSDGTDFRTGTVNYAAALEAGQSVRLKPDPDRSLLCGHGLHVGTSMLNALQYGASGQRNWRYFAGYVRERSIVIRDDYKMRVGCFHPTKELTLNEVFGDTYGPIMKRLLKELNASTCYPWFTPRAPVTTAQLKPLLDDWRATAEAHGFPRCRGLRLVKSLKSIGDLGVYFKEHTKAMYGLHARLIHVAFDEVADKADGACTTDFYVTALLMKLTSLLANDGDLNQIDDYIGTWDIFRTVVAADLLQAPANPWRVLLGFYRLGLVPLGLANDRFVVYHPAVKKQRKEN